MSISRNICLLLLLVTLLCGVGISQRKPVPTPSAPVDQAGRATAAFAEIALKRADLEAELQSLLIDYTDEFPRVKELKFALTRIEVQTARLGDMKPAERDRATTALGKLMVRKVEAETDLWKVQQDYADNHPDVRRAKKKVEIFEKAIAEILS